MERKGIEGRKEHEDSRRWYHGKLVMVGHVEMMNRREERSCLQRMRSYSRSSCCWFGFSGTAGRESDCVCVRERERVSTRLDSEGTEEGEVDQWVAMACTHACLAIGKC